MFYLTTVNSLKGMGTVFSNIILFFLKPFMLQMFLCEPSVIVIEGFHSSLCATAI